MRHDFACLLLPFRSTLEQNMRTSSTDLINKKKLRSETVLYDFLYLYLVLRLSAMLLLCNSPYIDSRMVKLNVKDTILIPCNLSR
jgi:hypothetical protein